MARKEVTHTEALQIINTTKGRLNTIIGKLHIRPSGYYKKKNIGVPQQRYWLSDIKKAKKYNKEVYPK